MCICINCKHIRQCKTYKFIENQHYNENIIKRHRRIDFIPINTVIVVNINKYECKT